MPLTTLAETRGFVLAWQVQWDSNDVDVAMPLVEAARAKYPTLWCSFDRGFHSPDNQRDLAERLTKVTLPVKGTGNAEARTREARMIFRRRHGSIQQWNPPFMTWRVMARRASAIADERLSVN